MTNGLFAHTCVIVVFFSALLCTWGKIRITLAGAHKPFAFLSHTYYNDVIMNALVSQITNLTIVYSIVYLKRRSTKNQSSATLAIVREFTGDRWIPRTKGQWRRKCFHLMTSSSTIRYIFHSWIIRGSIFRSVMCGDTVCRKLFFHQYLINSTRIFLVISICFEKHVCQTIVNHVPLAFFGSNSLSKHTCIYIDLLKAHMDHASRISIFCFYFFYWAATWNK